MTSCYLELLEMIDDLEKIVKKQINLINKLTNENLEKENMIKTLTTN